MASWMRPRGPTAGHGAAGEADSLTGSGDDDAPEALIGSRKSRATRTARSAGMNDKGRVQWDSRYRHTRRGGKKKWKRRR